MSSHNVIVKMNKFNMFITAVCPFLIKLRWPKNKVFTMYFNFFLDVFVRGRIGCFCYKFLILLGCRSR